MRSINGSLDRRIFAHPSVTNTHPPHARAPPSRSTRGLCTLFFFFAAAAATALPAPYPLPRAAAAALFRYYYYPETLRAASNSKSLKVIRSDLINEFYYLVVTRNRETCIFIYI